ncbi:alpha-D-ribose 1-methylphosphonate 5-triphosphate diphosphatase [Cohnella sp. OV330]|uniref:alpha-D-ribose 1-methylphosphonate 5-triphosphate diphosphatase n=1 Tax=Cohnella sp. OV330 TaxID=1855288 RepID=UPI0008EB5820|nr:alpha-D-ribose 1-methylphosphonate 5-triphosphate diphosphatase [Cohnella sp. OV330]SFB30211.1 alpha-D-ribose 1-methylphosphonate 5-triphosphate diphosphatase [Cohnella sp. OV330]
MEKKLWIRNGKIVLPGGVEQADIFVENGRIARIGSSGERGVGEDAPTIDADGAFVLPGLVDIHCDAIEKEVEPRPNTLFPLEMAFLQFERKLAGHGITTMYHSLSLGVGLSLRGEHLVSEMIGTIRRLSGARSMIRHRVHLRYEVSHLTGFPLAERLIREGQIDYLSLMDHAPGQGQYRRPGAFQRYVMKNQGVDAEECERIVEELQARRALIDWDKLRQLTALAREHGIAVASHDDDTPEQADRSMAYGASISEFPLNLETAAYASGKGMKICVGAPNIVRGGSHDKNLTAMEAVRAGAADIVCSDYHPASLLQSLFAMHAEGIPLHEAVRMASLEPAAALGQAASFGSIELGKHADLLVVRTIGDVPVVTDTIVEGTVVSQTRDYRI